MSDLSDFRIDEEALPGGFCESGTCSHKSERKRKLFRLVVVNKDGDPIPTIKICGECRSKLNKTLRTLQNDSKISSVHEALKQGNELDEFDIGDVVRAKSRTEAMTVVKVLDRVVVSNNISFTIGYECEWFHADEVRHSPFNFSELELVKKSGDFEASEDFAKDMKVQLRSGGCIMTVEHLMWDEQQARCKWTKGRQPFPFLALMRVAAT